MIGILPLLRLVPRILCVAGAPRGLRLGICLILGRVLDTIATRAQKTGIGSGTLYLRIVVGLVAALGVVVVVQGVTLMHRGRGQPAVIVDKAYLVVVVVRLQADDPTRAPQVHCRGQVMCILEGCGSGQGVA